MKFSKEDLQGWNDFKRKCSISRAPSGLKGVSIRGKELLSKVKQRIKNPKLIPMSEEYLGSFGDFILEKDKSLGIDRSSDKKLSKGDYKIDFRLDLHGLTIDEAYNKVKQLFERANRNDYRFLLIITGKGLHSSSKTIKESLIEWFRKPYFSDKIIKYTNASKSDGGDGAVYVLLRRN